MTPEDRVVTYASPERVRLAADWYGGGGSMLYAVASTGALSLGTVMPYGCQTEFDWRVDLAERLYVEVRNTAREAAAHPDADARADAEPLAEWADDLSVWLSAALGCASCGAEWAEGVSVGDDRGPAEGVCGACVPALLLPEAPVLPPRAERLPRHVYRFPSPIPLTTEGVD